MIMIEERGKKIGQEDFEEIVGSMREEGKRKIIVEIGGKEGNEKELRQRDDIVMEMGEIKWKKKIESIMIEEKI